MTPPVGAAILVVSDRVAAGTHQDASGPAAREGLALLGLEVVAEDVVPDERDRIAARLRAWSDDPRIGLVVTSGGTGFAERDVTPEATAEVLERETPGLSELLRAESRVHTPLAVLSRGRSGIRNHTLIVNLPGSPRGVLQCLEILKPVLPHALRVVAGDADGHQPPEPRTEA